MENLTENMNGEILYKNDIILWPAGGSRKTLQHQKQVDFETYSLKFEEIVLETQVQLRKRFEDFELLSLKNLCELFDFKLWPKSFNEDKNGDLIFFKKCLHSIKFTNLSLKMRQGGLFVNGHSFVRVYRS